MESTLTESDVGRLQSIGEARFSKYRLPLPLSQRSPIMHNFNSSRLKANLDSSLGNVWSQLIAPMIFYKPSLFPDFSCYRLRTWFESDHSQGADYIYIFVREGQILGRKKVACWSDLE